MGLCFSHGSAHWSYSGFNRFRDRLAKIIKYKCWVDSESGLWPGEEPISLLMEHSDCDGYIHWSLCKPLADRLEEVLKCMSTLSKSNKEDWDYLSGMELVEGLRAAYKEKENFVFW